MNESGEGQESVVRKRGKPMGMLAAFFVSGYLALAFSFCYAVAASFLNLAFGGIVVFGTVVMTTGIGAVAGLLIGLILKWRRKPLMFRSLLIEVAIVSAVGVAVMSWRQKREILEILFKPAPVPPGVRVLNGRQELFGVHVHFTAPPGVLSSVIQAKGLVEVPETEEGTDSPGWPAREQSKRVWDWWNPTNMPGAKFFFRHHLSQAVQGWTEEWWVNGETNEVYADSGG
jgi:hypothetical protein